MSYRRIALLAAVFNLPFVLFRVHRLAFDTYVHIFLADHYRQRWWDLVEPRWYLGFSVASYPPLIHQLIALVSWPVSALIRFFAPAPTPYPGAFRVLGEEVAYIAILVTALLLFPLATGEWARVFVGPRTADRAALLSVFLPALSQTAWAFGQLPTLGATVAILLALTRGYAYLRTGRWGVLAQAVALAGTAGALHHGVFLLVPFAGAAVALRALIAGRGHVGARGFALRLVLWPGLSALMVTLVVWPFALWSMGQALQTPIDHASRHSFLTDSLARRFFFWPAYGALMAVVPAAVWAGLRLRRFWPLLGTCALLFALGLGGTTPLPSLLFGRGWEWLTYDRFNLWAASLSLPLVGALLVGRWRRAAPTLLALMITSASISGWLSVLSKSQPAPVDLAPIVRFLVEPAQQPYRYFTLGFGDQAARLAALVDNGSPDGAYHTARTLPELRASGLASLDTALWQPAGVWAVRPFLEDAGRYGARWAFVNHEGYVPVLKAAGWVFRWKMGDVGAWEKPDVTPVLLSARGHGTLADYWWGVAPLAVLGAALFSLAWPRLRRVTRQALGRGLSAARSWAWSITVVLCLLTWVHVLRAGPLPEVYFTYQSVLIYAGDAAAAFTLLLWAGEKAVRGGPFYLGPRSIPAAGLALLVLSGLSAFASQDAPVSLALVAHLSLLALLFLMGVNDPPGRAHVGALFGALLVGQASIALVQVAQQSTYALGGWHLLWPGLFTAAESGASVVANANGDRWLRAYGTLPHPNVLGGVTLILMGVAAARHIETGRRLWLGAIALTAVTLVLTFSRSAWIGAAAVLLVCAVLAGRRARPYAGRTRTTVAVAGIAVLMTALPLLPYLLPRAGLDGEAALERKSLTDRAALTQLSLALIRSHPLLGVGAGTFVQSVARVPGQTIALEPVHNIILLVAAETGVLGGLAALGLGAAVLWRIWRQARGGRWPDALWCLALVGPLTTAWFDHYWWTLAPARTLLVIVLGLWIGYGQHSPSGGKENARETRAWSISTPAVTRTPASTSGG